MVNQKNKQDKTNDTPKDNFPDTPCHCKGCIYSKVLTKAQGYMCHHPEGPRPYIKTCTHRMERKPQDEGGAL